MSDGRCRFEIGFALNPSKALPSSSSKCPKNHFLRSLVWARLTATNPTRYTSIIDSAAVSDINYRSWVKRVAPRRTAQPVAFSRREPAFNADVRNDRGVPTIAVDRSPMIDNCYRFTIMGPRFVTRRRRQ